MEAMKTENYELAKKVEPLEEVIDDIGDEVKQRHIDRLREGRCTIELGFVSNIAVCLIQAENNEFGRHEYLNSLKEEDNKYFKEQFREYRRKYSLPERVKGTPKVDMRARMQQAH